MFSVLIPTKGRPRLLQRALGSVLTQTGVCLEVIVIDDGGGEGIEAASQLGDDRIRCARAHGSGQVPALNQALAMAEGAMITCLDDDDWWADSGHLAAMADCLCGGVLLAYAGGVVMIEAAGGSALESIRFDAFADGRSLRLDNTLLTSGISYPKELHVRLGPFDERLPYYWDWDWYLRLAAAGVPFRAAASSAVRYSVRGNTQSSMQNDRERRANLDCLIAKHGLGPIALKNHLTIAREQSGD
jgi:glycosyltransferase involved in cell wall biosynthesis